MDRIAFDSNLQTGIPEVDRQHELLVEIYNELVDAQNASRGNRVMNEILARLFQYSKDHFADEEELMVAHGFPQLAEHQEQHAELVKSIRGYVLRHSRNGERITREMVQFVGKWITDHILIEDMKYVDCLKGRVDNPAAPSDAQPAAR